MGSVCKCDKEVEAPVLKEQKKKEPQEDNTDKKEQNKENKVQETEVDNYIMGTQSSIFKKDGQYYEFCFHNDYELLEKINYQTYGEVFKAK